MKPLVLSALDGKNPIGFMAALGVLDVVTAHAPSTRLSWNEVTFRPSLVGPVSREPVVEMLVRDAEAFRSEPALTRLRYPKSGAGEEAHDLKPPPGFYRDPYLRSLLETGSATSLRFAAAFASDVVVDNNGNTKPTALHFTAGQQSFLAMVAELAEHVTAVDFEEALFGPWTYGRKLPVLQWDNAGSRDYALRSSDPSKEKKLGVPGADWLAFRSLPFFPVAPTGAVLKTTGCAGAWKTGSFRWPIWTVPAAARVVGALLTSPELFDADPRAMKERGVAVVLEASIKRSDQGGYGSFTPARVAERTPHGGARLDPVLAGPAAYRSP
jgi:hypothetical protein